jgi:hypothetical protein
MLWRSAGLQVSFNHFSAREVLLLQGLPAPRESEGDAAANESKATKTDAIE